MRQPGVPELSVLGRESSGKGRVLSGLNASLCCVVNGQFCLVRGDQPPVGEGQIDNWFLVTIGQNSTVRCKGIKRCDYHV